MLELDQGGRGRRWTRGVGVPGALQGLVERIDVARVPDGEVGGWRIVADASGHLLVHCHRDGRVQVRLVGARRRYVDTVQAGRAWTLAVRFRAGALRCLVPFPAAELTDRGIDAGDVWGTGVEAIADAALARGPEEAVAVVCRLLSARADARPDPRTRAFVREVQRLEGRARVAEVARSVGAAGRTLRDLAAAEVGLSPVSVVRILRLQSALLRHGRGAAESWSRAAHASGYADQAHLNRDCRDLLGEAPGRFLARASAPPIRSRRLASEAPA